MYKLCFFVPESHLEAVKKSVFDAGAGCYQNYDQCCWQTEGTGQFRPLANSTPFLGSKGNVEQIREFKVEMLCEDQYLENAVTALVSAHPYEEPAFEYWPVGISRNLK